MKVDNLFDVAGKTALVTGASAGIGYMIADGLAAAGCKVFMCSRKAADIQAAAASLAPAETIAISADLATEAGIAEVARIVNAAGPLHILVNNAGATWGAPIDEFPRKGFEKVINLNLLAPFDLTRSLLPALRAAAKVHDPARVINIASLAGITLPPWENYPYTASKAGLIHMSRQLAKFLANENISVNSIAPGFFPSKMTATVTNLDDPAAVAEASSPLGGRIGTPEDVVGAVIYLASRAGAWLTGITIPVGGGSGTAE
jgi:NAD(P)-dependent dehydrogenase (short-subunit alcohol dehydrogenase family)